MTAFFRPIMLFRTHISNLFAHTYIKPHRKDNDMSVQKTAYVRYAEKSAKKSPLVADCAKAFFVGGAICLLGQFLIWLYDKIGLSETTVKMLVPSTIVFLTAIATALGWFDQLGKFGGAGTLVPISGFANSVVAPAIDNKADERDIIGLRHKALHLIEKYDDLVPKYIWKGERSTYSSTLG